jgi:hypothetical protein
MAVEYRPKNCHGQCPSKCLKQTFSWILFLNFCIISDRIFTNYWAARLWNQ